MSNNTNNENNDNYYQKLEENNITLNSNATNNERTSLVDKQKTLYYWQKCKDCLKISMLFLLILGLIAYFGFIWYFQPINKHKHL